MRTVVNLDDEIARLVKEEARRSGNSFEVTMNDLLRAGLQARRTPLSRRRFVVKPRQFGTGLGTRYKNLEELLEALDGPMHR